MVGVHYFGQRNERRLLYEIWLAKEAKRWFKDCLRKTPRLFISLRLLGDYSVD
jgi:hypothetical protein